MSENSGLAKTAKAEKTDRRVLRTRDTLGDALLELMGEKHFDDITVQQVLDRAGVGRSTFYAHYSDKDDLFLSDVEDFFVMIAGALTLRKANPRRLAPVAEFFQHLGDSKTIYDRMVASGKVVDVITLGRGIFARAIEERLQLAGVVLGPMELAAQAHALAGSLFALLDWWMHQGMKADPKEMDALFHRMAWCGLEAGSGQKL